MRLRRPPGSKIGTIQLIHFEFNFPAPRLSSCCAGDSPARSM